METVEWKIGSGKRMVFLPDQPSLKYPSTQDEYRERNEEKAIKAIITDIEVLLDFLEETCDIEQEDGIELIKQTLDTEFKK